MKHDYVSESSLFLPSSSTAKMNHELMRSVFPKACYMDASLFWLLEMKMIENRAE